MKKICLIIYCLLSFGGHTFAAGGVVTGGDLNAMLSEEAFKELAIEISMTSPLDLTVAIPSLDKIIKASSVISKNQNKMEFKAIDSTLITVSKTKTGENSSLFFEGQKTIIEMN